MNKITRYLLIAWTLLISCNGNGPVTVDFDIANATIIGREICSTDTNLNAWLIDLGPTTAGKTSRIYYGKEATINGKYYAHTVKTYSSLVSSLDSTKQYSFDFYIEDVIPSPSCNLANFITVNVPQIRVTAVPTRSP